MTTEQQAKPPVLAEDLAREEREHPEVTDDGLVLDLDELKPKRASVIFESKRYELRAPQEFGVNEEHTIQSESREFQALKAKDHLNKADRARYKQRLDELFDKVLDAPPEVRAQLNDKQRQWVVTLFSIALFNEEGAVTMLMRDTLEPLTKMARDLLPTTES